MALKIYKSSAGSGKTFTLVKEYLLLVLKNPDDFRSVLAITFTNKAAEEMKSRIVEALVELSGGKESALKETLESELPKINIRIQSERALKNILHDYSNFSVSTIDSFFQRILRSLAREIHLPLKMEVEINTDDAILSVTEALFHEIGSDKELSDWLTDLVLQKLDLDKGWNIEADISSVAREIFNESSSSRKVLSRQEIREIYSSLREKKMKFTRTMAAFGKEGLEAIRNGGFDIDDFSYKSSGVAGYFRKIAQGKSSDDFQPGSRVLKGIESADTWISKNHAQRNELLFLTEEKLLPLLRKAMEFFEKEFTDYCTTDEVLKKIYLFGLVNDLQSKFREYRREKNVILLADTTRLLSEVISDHDTPFVYEKTGNRFKHLLIDEFQDTSLLQWKNLMPLIINTLGSGFITLVVGDAKQSIYRWRGGNMNLLIKDIYVDLTHFRSLVKQSALATNYRSKKEIVEFNNRFFKEAKKLLQNDDQNDGLLELAYGQDLEQVVAAKNNQGGYVQVDLISTEEINVPDDEDADWKDEAMRRMLEAINDLIQNKKYQYKDIAILVRKNTDGNKIANFLLENKIEKIISPDSLMLNSSPAINFLINIFRFLADQGNQIARAEFLLYYVTHLSKPVEDIHKIFSDHKVKGSTSKKKQESTTLFDTGQFQKNVFNEILPEEFTGHIPYLSNLPVYELSEQLVRIFNLAKEPDAFIQRFQDLILEYSVSQGSSTEGFLNWWDNNSKVSEASVVTPEDEDAIRIMTIHRSKGLQFPIVFIPFCEWDLQPKSNELIWLETNHSPYNELGKTALLTSSKLENTFYSEGYLDEVHQTLIDNLNLIYVAFTRPEKQLIIYCPAASEKSKSSADKEKRKASKLISAVLHQMTGAEQENYIFGGASQNDKKKSDDSSDRSFTLQTYGTYRWQERLSLATHSHDLIELVEDSSLTKINYGILVHSILAEIRDISEAERVGEKFVYEGMITENEMPAMLEEIRQVLNVPEIAAFFKKDLVTMNEREILLPDGEMLRPDKVILSESETIVVDFKSGKPLKKHESQIKRYADVLRSMGYPNVKAKLVYLGDREVVEV